MGVLVLVLAHHDILSDAWEEGGESPCSLFKGSCMTSENLVQASRDAVTPTTPRQREKFRQTAASSAPSPAAFLAKWADYADREHIKLKEMCTERRVQGCVILACLMTGAMNTATDP